MSVQFSKLVATVTDIKGEIILFDNYRAVFTLLNEVYVVTVGYKKEYPFDILSCCEKAKK